MRYVSAYPALIPLAAAALLWAAPLNAQSLDDPCVQVDIVDRTNITDFEYFKMKLSNSSAAFRAVEDMLGEVSMLVGQNSGKPEFQAKFDAEKIRTKAMQDPAVRASLTALGAACVERLKDFPNAHVDAVGRTAKRQLDVLNMAPAARADALRREAEKLRADWATPAAAEKTLKLDTDRLRAELAKLKNRIAPE